MVPREAIPLELSGIRQFRTFVRIRGQLRKSVPKSPRSQPEFQRTLKTAHEETLHEIAAHCAALLANGQARPVNRYGPTGQIPGTPGPQYTPQLRWPSRDGGNHPPFAAEAPLTLRCRPLPRVRRGRHVILRSLKGTRKIEGAERRNHVASVAIDPVGGTLRRKHQELVGPQDLVRKHHRR